MKMPQNEKNSSSNHTSINFSISSNDSGIIIIDNTPPKSAPGQKQENMHSDCHGPPDNSDKANSSQINIQNFINITKTENENINQERQTKQLLQPAPSKSPWHSTKNASSPTVSIRSTTISIVSTDENEIDSSVVESDSEVEAGDGSNDQYRVKKLGHQITYEPNSPDIPNVGRDMIVLSQKICPNGATDMGPLPSKLLGDSGCLGPASNTPQIGSIALSNSTDVTFGDKHFYEGPVTIQQFLIDSREKWKPANVHEDQEGQDNPFCNQYNEFKQTEVDHSCIPSVPPKHPLHPYGFVFNRKAAIITVIIIILSTLLVGVLIITASNLSTVQKIPTVGDDIFNGTLHFVKRDVWKAALPKSDMDKLNLPVHMIIISHTASAPCSDIPLTKRTRISSLIGKDNIGSGKVLRIVPRDGWLAQPPSSKPIALLHPVPQVVIISTQTDGCETQAACTYRVRFIQTYNIESTQYDDIIYNFLIGGDGNVYEGRGWDNVGAHLKGHNHNSISLAFIGTFRTRQPTNNQMNATTLLLQEGVRQGKLSSNYKIIAANKIEPTSTATSADALYASFKGWPHWSEL